MAFGLGTLLTAALVSGGVSLLGNHLNNQFQAKEAQKNRDWQEEMSNTAYQRATEDMRNAGINPILSYSQGGANVGSVGNPSANGYPSLGLPLNALEDKETRKLQLSARQIDLEQKQLNVKRGELEYDIALNSYDNYKNKYIKHKIGFGV